jgi:hypothetical protein
MENGLITPVPKISQPVNYGDLRPVCVLPVLLKVLERLIFQQIMTFLEDHKIIPICQSGFRKRHSTATALINVFDDILRALDKGMMTLLILLDFSKAFDTISHNFFLVVTNFVHLKHASACLNRTFKNALFHGNIARFPWKHHQTREDRRNVKSKC